MADNGNDGKAIPPPLQRGSYNFNFDDLDENINPFQSCNKMGSSPPINRGIKVTAEIDANPFKSKSNLGRSPPQSPLAGPKLVPVSNTNSGDVAGFGENIDHFALRKSLQNSPPSSPLLSVSKQRSVEIIQNTVEEVIIDDDDVDACQTGESPRIKGKPPEEEKIQENSPISQGQNHQDTPPKASPSPQSKQSSKKQKKAKRLSADVTETSPPVTTTKMLDSEETIKEIAVEKLSDPCNNNNKIEASDLEVAKAIDVETSSELTTKAVSSTSPTTLTPKDIVKKSPKIKKPVKPRKIADPVEEAVKITSPKPTEKEAQTVEAPLDMQEKNTNLNANPSKIKKVKRGKVPSPNPTSMTGEVIEGTQLLSSAPHTVEPGGGGEADLSQTDDGMGESVQDDFPGELPGEFPIEDFVPRKDSLEEEDHFVDCVESGVHEFGTSDDHGLGDMGDEPNEEFVPATEVFSDPNGWEMLEKLGGQSSFKDTDLARQSLYVKFDPLAQNSTEAAKAQSTDKTRTVPNSAKQGDDLLMQMNTPPVQSKKGSSKQTKHPAAKQLEQNVEGQSVEVSGAREVDRIYAMSPHSGEKDIDECDVLKRQYSIPEMPPAMSDSWFDQVNTFKEMEDSTMSQDSVDIFSDWSPAQGYSDDRTWRSSSQDLEQDADSGHAGSACTASPPNIGHSQDPDDLLDMLKFSQHDMNKLRQEMELEFQGRLLSKEKDWNKKNSDLVKERSNLRDQMEKIKAAHEDMKCIVSDYEKTISQLVADKEQSSSESKESMVEIIKDRDQAVEDLRSVEAAFSDLHRRYEKIKTVVEAYKKNEEILKKSVQDYQGKLKSAEQRFQGLKQQAEDKLSQANMEIDKVRKTTSSELAKLEAAVKKKDLQVKSLDNSLEQKVKENKELTAICDELISEVGTQ